jgi:WD40 repeat protein
VNHENHSAGFIYGNPVAARCGAGWTVRIWDVASQRELTVLHNHRGAVNAVVFQADGQVLATGSSDETIKLWSIESRTVMATLQGHASGVNAIAFSPNSTQLVSGAMDVPIRVWNLVR